MRHVVAISLPNGHLKVENFTFLKETLIRYWSGNCTDHFAWFALELAFRSTCNGMDAIDVTYQPRLVENVTLHLRSTDFTVARHPAGFSTKCRQEMACSARTGGSAG